MNRRNFLKGSLLSSGAMMSVFAGATSFNEVEESIKKNISYAKKRKQLFNMCGYTAPKIPVVRIGYVGLGARGGWAVNRMQNIKDIEVTALCDIKEGAVKNSQNTLKTFGKQPAKEYYGNETSWKKLCEQDDIDLVYIATSWRWHV
ncbi:MAG: acetylgalactosaminidase, partial [Prevotella sp.]|nr:acetylgalactosaminidase [Prevotella sp.]